MAPRRALKNPDEIARIPLDEAVTIDLTPDPPKAVELRPDQRQRENNEPIDQVKANEKFIDHDVTPRDPPKRGRPKKEAVSEADESTVKITEFQNRIKEMEEAEAQYKNELAAERAEKERLRKLSEDSASETIKYRTAAESAEYDSVVNALGASQSEAEAAQSAYEQAIEAADVKAMANAQRRIARAESQIVALETAKVGLEQRQEERKAAPKVEPRQAPAQDFDNALARLPPKAQVWIKAHPEFFNDAAKNRRIQAVHSYITDVEGIQEFSDKYYEELETRLGLKQKEVVRDDEDDEEDDEVNDRQAALSSAPVIRESNYGQNRDTPTRLTLTPEQRQAAKMAGVSEVDYAMNLLKLRQLKREGHYNES